MNNISKDEIYGCLQEIPYQDNAKGVAMLPIIEEKVHFKICLYLVLFQNDCRFCHFD